MAISPQSQQLYQLLLNSNNPLSAKELGVRLGIFPNTVYRLAEPLIDMSLITKSSRYPYQFAARPMDEGLSLFLLYQDEWFSKRFTSGKEEDKRKGGTPTSQEISLSFIQSRDELMKYSAEEAAKATKSIDLLRSGHEISADAMLAMIEAKKRNVVTRMLIQDYSADNADQVSYWKKNGILVQKTSLRLIRLMLYDSRVVYFMSFKHAESKKDLGMKISYPPFAVILSQLFEEWWQKADII